MNLSKIKFALVGAMIMGVFSLNLMNPFAMSNNEFDAKGMAHEISISTTSVQGESAVIPTTVLLVAGWAFIHYSATLTSSIEETSTTTNISVFDQAAKVSKVKLAMNRLD